MLWGFHTSIAIVLFDTCPSSPSFSSRWTKLFTCNDSHTCSCGFFFSSLSFIKFSFTLRLIWLQHLNRAWPWWLHACRHCQSPRSKRYEVIYHWNRSTICVIYCVVNPISKREISRWWSPPVEKREGQRFTWWDFNVDISHSAQLVSQAES